LHRSHVYSKAEVINIIDDRFLTAFKLSLYDYVFFLFDNLLIFNWQNVAISKLHERTVFDIETPNNHPILFMFVYRTLGEIAYSGTFFQPFIHKGLVNAWEMR